MLDQGKSSKYLPRPQAPLEGNVGSKPTTRQLQTYKPSGWGAKNRCPARACTDTEGPYKSPPRATAPRPEGVCSPDQDRGQPPPTAAEPCRLLPEVRPRNPGSRAPERSRYPDFMTEYPHRAPTQASPSRDNSGASGSPASRASLGHTWS